MFQIRTSKPGAGNKNYITTGAGGWNTCITGYPQDRECNVLANCVGYASGRFNEIINTSRGSSGCTYKTLNCNAENFVERAVAAGLSTGSVPRVGAIMCWQKGSLASSDGAGHVAIVEKVYSNSSVYTSESGYGGSAFWNSTRSNSNGRWGIGAGYSFRCFIYLPGDVQRDVDGSQPAPSPSGKFKVGDKVIIDGPLYSSSNASSPVGSVSNKTTNITRVANGAAHPYNTTGDLGWMNEANIRYAEEPKPGTLKYKIGDSVIINGPLYVSSYASSPVGNVSNKKTTITRTAPGKAHPYNTTGDLGWMNESSISYASGSGEIGVGDKVVITGKYANSSEAASARYSAGIGWTVYVTKIYSGRKFPYQLGTKAGNTSGSNTVGFATKDSIRKA